MAHLKQRERKPVARHKRKQKPAPTGMKVFVGLLVGLTVAMVTVGLTSNRSSTPTKTERTSNRTTEPVVKKTPIRTPLPKNVEPSPTLSTFYLNCDAAKAVGALPLLRGDAGYRTDLDMDGDGTACEGV